MTSRMPVVFIGHGSPMIALDDNQTTRTWARMAASIPRPKAILAISAHWLTRGTAVTAMAKPKTIHDFGAFPQALFDVQYPAPGDPALAARVASLLAPTPVLLDQGDWGLDHGTWSVLVKAFPAADIPVVQLGMDVAASPADRFELGRRLAPLRDEGVLIMGTGNIVHNLGTMDRSNPRAAPYDWAERFRAEINDAIVKDQPARVIDYASLGRDAGLSVPNPDHFWPLLYVLGARSPGDRLVFETDHIEPGSRSMTTVVLAEAA